MVGESPVGDRTLVRKSLCGVGRVSKDLRSDFRSKILVDSSPRLGDRGSIAGVSA